MLKIIQWLVATLFNIEPGNIWVRTQLYREKYGRNPKDKIDLWLV